MRYSYHTEQWVPHPVERVFDFFANPRNLPLLMPEWQGARIDAASIVAPLPPESARFKMASESVAAGPSSRLTLSFMPFPRAPFRVHWEAEIDAFVWDMHFCDRQVHGPFAYWKHCHYFRQTDQLGAGGTTIMDDLEYELPFGPVGKFANRVFLRREIERVFAYRQGQLTRVLAGATKQSQPRPSL